MRLLNDDGKAIECKSVQPSSIGLLSEERLKILQLLSEKPHYPAELARALNMPVQTVYYHIRLLEQAELIKFVDYEEHQGGVAKRYANVAKSIAVVIDQKGWKAFAAMKKKVPALFAPFVIDGCFDGKIVVGSPEPHGKYRARASELGIVELAMLLGQYATFSFPVYSLDTQVKPEEKKQNLILAGGPKVNTLVAEINEHLPARFDQKNFEVYSSFSKKSYAENIGIIELVQSPFSKHARILLIGGLNYHGTRAAVLAIVEKMNWIEMGNTHKPEAIAKIVEGFDEDGDGMVDAVEILE